MTDTGPMVRIGSHRAREKLERLLGTLPQTYFSWHREGQWCEVPAEKLTDALLIKGISNGPRVRDDLRKSWSFL